MWPRVAPGAHKPDESQNRRKMRLIVESGDSPGLIALADDGPVGWCALGPVRNYPQYETGAAPPRGDVWAIPCLYVKHGANRRAVAAALIESAVACAADRGASTIEGLPPWWLPGDSAAVALATGDLLANGFERVGAGARMPVLRRQLSAKG